MSATPLIKNLNTQGGTFFAFSSAVNQEQMAATNDDLKFSFSKFVALDIPDIKTPINKENNIQFLSIDGQIYDGLSPYNSVNLVQSLQNYCLNLESLLINYDNYDNTKLRTVSERVFFKWLKEIGALRFRQANTNESNEFRFTEEDTKLTGDTIYKKVVKYIGDVDIVNNVSHGGESYTEVYLQMSSLVGTTPIVLFEAYEDDNYQSDMIVKGTDEFLYNRDTTTVHPENLSLSAFYDYDTNMEYTASTNANWYNQDAITGSTNSYFTEPITFSDPSNIEITKNSGDYSGTDAFSTFSYLRTKLDGISVDFDLTSYTEITNDASINSLQEYNSDPKSEDFEFNAVLLYYDIYNESNPNQRETNLYGILIIDNLIENVGESYIPRFKKNKFNKLLNVNGNSYGLRVNFKNTQSILNSGVETIINDYNSFSMSLFSDTMVQLQNSVIHFQNQSTQLMDIQKRLENLETSIFDIPAISDLQIRIDAINEMIDNYQTSFADSSVFLNLISKLNDKVNQIINNETSVELQFNTDVVQAGAGIELDKSVNDRFIIKNKTQAYNLTQVIDVDGNYVNTENLYDPEINEPKLYTYLKEYTNFVKLYTISNSVLETHLKLYLSDKNFRFQDGQSVKISFANKLDFSSYDLIIYSDHYNKFGFGEMGKIVARINSLELSDKPLIEIICVDANNYLFDYEILR